MYRKRLCLVVGAAVALAVALAVLVAVKGGLAIAGEPAKVVRTFGYYTNQTDPALAPDFEGDNSIGVVAQASEIVAPPVVQFAESCSGELAGTVWVLRPARHMNKGGSEEEWGQFFWLRTPECPEPPEPGAFARTGPDGWILSPGATLYKVSPCTGGDCEFGSTGKFCLKDWGICFVVVTAEFTK